MGKKLNRGAKLLFELLQGSQAGQVYARNEFLERMNWSESTLKTYLTKNMLSPFILAVNGDLKVLRAGADVTEADIKAAFSQVRPGRVVLSKNIIMKGEHGDYVLERELGHGAVGHVWLSKRQDTKQTVAVKVVNPREDLLASGVIGNVTERFRRESKNGGALQHDSIVKHIDSGMYENHPFLVMECARESLRDRLDRGPLTEPVALEIMKRVTEGLLFLHEKGCVHRDVKPDNILLCDHGWVLGDLGIVKWSDFHDSYISAGTITRGSVQLGSWHYMAPEQLKDPHDAELASDIYALGITYFEMLTKETPSHSEVAADDISGLPDGEALNLIRAMTSYKREKRPTAHAVLERINRRMTELNG